MLPWKLAGGFSHYLVDCLSIVVIDLLLAGDNALVIALSVRTLPGRERRIAMLAGAWMAVALRVAVTFLAARLLQVEYVQFAGGVFVVWIAVKVLRDARAHERAPDTPSGLWRAIGSIVVADLTMSADNISALVLRSRASVTGMRVHNPSSMCSEKRDARSPASRCGNALSRTR